MKGTDNVKSKKVNMHAETGTPSAFCTLLRVHRGRGFQGPVLVEGGGAATMKASQGSLTDNSSCSFPDNSVDSHYLTTRSIQQRSLPFAKDSFAITKSVCFSAPAAQRQRHCILNNTVNNAYYLPGGDRLPQRCKLMCEDEKHFVVSLKPLWG